jgi:hypothetical protein
MPTPFCRRKAVSGSDRYGKVVLESPESLARACFPGDCPGTQENSPSPPTPKGHLLHWEVRDPKGQPEGHGGMAEQSYDAIVPVRVANRRASARERPRHPSEGRGNKRTHLLKET